MWNIINTSDIFRRNQLLRVKGKKLYSQLKEQYDCEYDDDRIAIRVGGKWYTPPMWNEMFEKLLKQRDDRNDQL